MFHEYPSKPLSKCDYCNPLVANHFATDCHVYPMISPFYICVIHQYRAAFFSGSVVSIWQLYFTDMIFTFIDSLVFTCLFTNTSLITSDLLYIHQWIGFVRKISSGNHTFSHERSGFLVNVPKKTTPLISTNSAPPKMEVSNPWGYPQSSSIRRWGCSMK